MTKFKTWKTIKLGTGLKTGDDFRKALWKAYCHIGFSNEANDILDNPAFIIAPEEMEVELVNVSVADLCFTGSTNCASVKDVYIRAQEMGLSICPEEVGPQLRLQYLDQAKGWEQHIIIGMKPVAITKIEISKKKLGFYVFDVIRDQKLWFSAIEMNPEETCYHTNRFIFLQQKQLHCD